MHTRLQTKVSSLLQLSVILGLCGILSCNNSEDSANESTIDSDYHQEIKDWHDARISSLKRPRSWASLVALEWLTEGESNFGGGQNNTIVYEGGPERIGTWNKQGDHIEFTSDPSITVVNGDTTFLSGRVNSDTDDDTHIFQQGPLFWMVIHRGNQYGVRIWDSTAVSRTDLDTVPYFPIDKKWRIDAQFVEASEQDSIVMANAVGQSITNKVAGYVEFDLNGETQRLTALNGGTQSLFMIISDMTTDIETYAAGRYMYIPRADENGTTVIDFNKSYNPPCVFTDFATCLLPPDDNYIPARVEAGELNYGHH